MGSSWADQSWLLGLSSYSEGQSHLSKAFAFKVHSPILVVRWNHLSGVQRVSFPMEFSKAQGQLPHEKWGTRPAQHDLIEFQHKLLLFLAGVIWVMDIKSDLDCCLATNTGMVYSISLGLVIPWSHVAAGPHNPGIRNALRHQHGQNWESKPVHLCGLWWYLESHPSTQTLAVGGLQT